MMGQQVRRHAELGLQLGRRKVPEGQEVHNAQTRRIGEGGMLGYPLAKPVNYVNSHCLKFD
jgi:hypothetical protein